MFHHHDSNFTASSDESCGNWPPPGRRRRHPAGDSTDDNHIDIGRSNSNFGSGFNSPYPGRFGSANLSSSSSAFSSPDCPSPTYENMVSYCDHLGMKSELTGRFFIDENNNLAAMAPEADSTLQSHQFNSTTSNLLAKSEFNFSMSPPVQEPSSNFSSRFHFFSNLETSIDSAISDSYTSLSVESTRFMPQEEIPALEQLHISENNDPITNNTFDSQDRTASLRRSRFGGPLNDVEQNFGGGYGL